MEERHSHSLHALIDFRTARRRAFIEDLLARLTGKSSDLLAYDEVRRRLRLQGAVDRGLRDIPLDAIVGSVGRYSEFSRQFMPRRWHDRVRWSRVWQAVDHPLGVPPIDVYQIGDVYFVQDGNHRVSVARSLGASHIQARVTEIQTRVPLTPDVTADDLIIKSEYLDFLERTRLDEIIPNLDLSVTVAGQYQLLAEHIETQRQLLERQENQSVGQEEALRHWYATSYLPVVQSIRAQGLLRDFPGRSETDLYIWIMEHRAELEQEIGWAVAPQAVAAELASRHSRKPNRIAARIGEQLLALLRPETFAPGPAPGSFRRRHEPGDDARLFADILVPIRGDEASWPALEAALAVAGLEGGRLHGLHIVGEHHQRDGAAAQAVRERFDTRCAAAALEGELGIGVGRDVVAAICERARWADLVALQIVHPPNQDPLARLLSGFRALLQRCPQPILAVPCLPNASSFKPTNGLLSYDGSPKAQEALAVAAYLALRWQLRLTLLSVGDGPNTAPLLARAHAYLEAHGVTATPVAEPGAVAPTILAVAAHRSCDLIITGGYGLRPELEIMLGSTLDRLVRASSVPLLICR